ncbi:MAG: prolipoprotein diacylglyceryl transferase [Candidatus Chisholmbacteria bacterium]|nr:prolipoprotein diacylglyceryl transferase [Candidatus Chisholmbacteria bacterium]
MYPVLFSLGPIIVSTYGVFLVMAFLVGAFVVWKKGREEHFEEEDLFDATLLATFWGLVGARLVYVLLHLSEFGINPVRILGLTRFPGLSFFGALFGGVVAVVLYGRAKKWDVFETLDLFTLGMVAGQVVGLLGAFLNGTGFGIRTNLPWAVSFPGVEGSRHPTQLYAAGLLVVVFLFLNKVFAEYRTYEWYKGSANTAASGLTFFSYLTLWGLISLGAGFLTPSSFYWLGLPLLTFASGPMILWGIFGAYIRSGRTIEGDLGALGGSFKRRSGRGLGRDKRVGKET